MLNKEKVECTLFADGLQMDGLIRINEMLRIPHDYVMVIL